MPVGFDKVTIANMALSHVGSKSTIESLNENNTPAKVCKLWYEGSRMSTLEVFNWTFARKSIALTTHADAAPTNRYAYRYQMPSDCLKPRLIENPLGMDYDAIPFEVETSNGTLSLLTDQEQATLIYTFDQQDVALFSFHFVQMMAVRLAIFINPEITGKSITQDRLERKFEKLMTEAPNSDADGEFPRPERDPVWIRERA